jgi:EAL domain-containing protein (putative c-di-GMP-specific phosphodiesterase class I)
VLSAAYQPIVDGGTGALVGFEALARLTDGDRLPIPPDVFVSVAENSTLIRPLGRRMLELACGQLAAWRRELPAMGRITMAVNVSALEAQHASWPEQVRRTLRAHGLVGPDLVLEITETALLHAANSTISALRELHEEGVGIALDDFGVGYASLRYLATLPVSAVKVDRSFTVGLPHDHTSRKIVAAVAGLAAELDMSCIVEGVETTDQRSALPVGVQVQGYLTGRPAAPGDIDVVTLARLGAQVRGSRARRGGAMVAGDEGVAAL